MEEIIEELFKSINKNAGNPDVIYTKKVENDDIHKFVDMFQGTPIGQILKSLQPIYQNNDNASTEGEHRGKSHIQPAQRQSSPQTLTRNVENKDSFAGVDIREMESYIAVIIDLPGVNKNSINLIITDDNVLKLNVDRTTLYSNSSDRFLQKERYCGVVTKSITLPRCIDKNTISATYVDGVLTVRFSKSSEATSSKKILIN